MHLDSFHQLFGSFSFILLNFFTPLQGSCVSANQPRMPSVVQTCEGKSLRRSQGDFTPCRLGSRDVRKNISCDLSDRQFFVFGARNTTLAWMFSRPLPDRHTALYEWQCCLGFVFRIVISVFLILLVASSMLGGRAGDERACLDCIGVCFVQGLRLFGNLFRNTG